MNTSLKKWAVRALCAYFALCAAFYAYTTFCAIANFGWHQPMFDQWRMYVTFLDLPFPLNVIQRENGHRPIIPNLIRVAEMNWFAANQMLQLSIGTLSAFMAAFAIAFTAWRQRELSPVARWAGVMLAVLGILWLANVRMLLHGNESLHAYLLIFAVVCAGLCTYRAQQQHSLRWLGLACVACTVAMFCFGPGVASFPAIILLGAILRLPWRWLSMPLATLGLCLCLYLFVLPENENVRQVLVFRPWESLQVSAQWLSAPWINGWLGMADPPAFWIFADPNAWYARIMIRSANAVVMVTGMSWSTLSTVLGFLGITYFAGNTMALLLRGQPLLRLQALAIVTGGFALLAAAVISISRLDYLLQHQDQIYADRYLLWSSLFWCSIALLALCDIARLRNLLPRAIGLAFVIALPVMLLFTQRSSASWGDILNRSAQQISAAARSNTFPEEQLTSDASASREDKLHTLEGFRERHLGMFAQTDWEQVGKQWSGTLEPAEKISSSARWLKPSVDVRSGHAIGHFEGWITSGLAQAQDAGQLTVLDPDGNVAGLAEYSFIALNVPALRFSIARKSAFDGYIRDYDPSKKYTLTIVDFRANHGFVLTMLPTQTPPQAAGGN